MIQLHQIWESKPQPIEFTFKNQVSSDSIHPYIFLLPTTIKQIHDGQEVNLQQQPLQVQTSFSYLKRSKELTKDLLNGGFQTLYSFEKSEGFQKSFVHQSKNCINLGCKLARTMQGQDNGVIILQNEITHEDINNLLHGFTLANYRWHMKSTQEGDGPKGLHQPIKAVTLVHRDINGESLSNYVELDLKAKLIYKLPNYIVDLRYIASLRANVANPTYMLEYVRKIKDSLGDSVKLTTIVGDELLDQRLNLIHAVGRTSKFPPALASLVYQGNLNQESGYLALIGKGVCFDTGGLSLKSTGGMEQMFGDKTGACTVLQAFKAIVELKLPLNVVCCVALVENSIGVDAYRVSDIIQSYKGLSVEILNTDAEGRLILVDAMSYVQHNYQVDVMVELSTLTGAIKTALGTDQAGLFTNSKDLVKTMKKISKLTKEDFWNLPITDEHRGNMRGQYSDLKNSTSAGGGSSNAAAFLEYFVEQGVKWMHWDIAAVDIVSSDKQTYNRGATGFGLQQIVYFAADLAKVLVHKKE